MSSSVPLTRLIREDPKGTYSLSMLVNGLHCPSCVALIENALTAQASVIHARLNLSTRRLIVRWQGVKESGDRWVELLQGMGYSPVPYDPDTAETQEKCEEKFLLRCLGVAGFASGNLMLFSVPLWSSDIVEMGGATRTLFHWIQAGIALPAIAYAGQPFYRSAWKAVRHGRANMDVPISIAVILATGMSLFETATHGAHAYFDSGVMLLFFLLIGRYLEARARGRARTAAQDLLHRMSGSTTILCEDGTQKTILRSEITEGMTLLVAAGEMIGADGDVLHGMSDVDASAISGESLPSPVQEGTPVFAGTINLTAPLTILVTRAHERSLIAEIVRLMETAEQAQARYVTLADRISGWYTPAVHALAAITFLGWWLELHAPWQEALLYAATVLIITCPCALGLAVPVVQVLASGKLMRAGILLTSGSALERLATITQVIFDKTGTLTLGTPALQNGDRIAPDMLQLAASLAAFSKHPLAVAVSCAWDSALYPLAVKEIKGCGLLSSWEGRRVCLGKRSWATTIADDADTSMELWLHVEGEDTVRFVFSDQLRADSSSVVSTFTSAGLGTHLLSGDRVDITRAIAQEVGIADAAGGLDPLQKTQRITAMTEAGEKVLMVGDGLNDAPSLAAATVSMSPTSAVDITQNAADIVFQGDKLRPVLTAWRTARHAQKLVKQNFALAMGYNVIAIPLAVAGYVTPLIAAITMSASSLLVIANAMRLNLTREKL